MRLIGYTLLSILFIVYGAEAAVRIYQKLKSKRERTEQPPFATGLTRKET